ncbi:MAG: dTDP-4-dehydrorhamnose 3,5-epimerase [Gammaproteobacteria bacterium RIFCSPHIGHO2_12_FULL_38_11]|nr:MAG: dTDP-4-dehydrorhamnose 3,5-epimerase [Gammaproteobacteria bacterium RIFCSPHIGHO2_12_FULL_38_11]
MKAEPLKILGMFLITLEKHGDERGFFLETYRESLFAEFGIHDKFVQDNRSFSLKNVLRGMHYQIQKPKANMVSVLRGKIFDVGVDLRQNSSTFGQWCGVELSAEKPQHLFLPAGVAHGFCTLSDENEMTYKCAGYYDPNDEGGLLWNDPIVGIEWPVANPLINERDNTFPTLSEISAWRLPQLSL